MTLAQRYDGHPGIEFVMIAPGIYGSTRAVYPPDSAISKRTGYTAEKWFMANVEIINIYKRHFKHTPLALNIAPFIDFGQSDPRFNEMKLAEFAAEQGCYVYYHDLRATTHWYQSAYPALLAPLAESQDSLRHGQSHCRQPEDLAKYGDPMSIVEAAFGGIHGMPEIKTSYIQLYSQDVSAATPGSRLYRKDYEQAMSVAFRRIGQESALARYRLPTHLRIARRSAPLLFPGIAGFQPASRRSP